MSDTATIASETQIDGPFPYGWRYVEIEVEGGFLVERIPLTYDDALHPQEGDQVTHSELHQRICVYLYNVLRALFSSQPTVAVLMDVRIAWDTPEVQPHGPDIMVIFDVQERRNWSTFDVAKEGVRPALIIEVTSPKTHFGDLGMKLDEYEEAGVPLYVIVDVVRRGKQSLPRLFGYRLVDTSYQPLALDERGWLWLEPIGRWIGIVNDQIALYDEHGTAMEDYDELVASRAELEARLRAMEAELRQLRGEA